MDGPPDEARDLPAKETWWEYRPLTGDGCLYYFPQMQEDEALLIKCFDSAEDGRARFTGRTAFDDPRSPPDAPPRESIELRALVFFGPEAGA